MDQATNIVWHPAQVTPEQRSGITRVRPATLWLTGLSGCGKSTIAMALEKTLVTGGRVAFVLDGDNVRHGLNRNLGFSDADRTENIRRIGEVAKLFVQAGALAISAFISPFRADRDAVRALLAPGQFVEIFVDAPPEVCELRDPKGLYKKARAELAAGRGMKFTGIDSPYEPPLNPEIHLHTDAMAAEACVEKVMDYLRQGGYLPC